MRPPSTSRGSACCVTKNGARRLIATMRSKSSGRDLLDRLAAADAGVVDENVEPRLVAALAQRGIESDEELLGGGRLDEIRGDGEGRAACGGDRCDHRLSRGAVAVEMHRDQRAHRRRAAAQWRSRCRGWRR